MKTKGAMWIWNILTVSLIFAIGGCTKAVTVKNKTAVVGSLKWEILEVASGRILASGNGPVYLKDMLITERPNTPRRLIDRRIKLSAEFDIGLVDPPTTNLAEKTGFALTARRTDAKTSSWDWFNIEGNNRAVKLQEGGVLGIKIEEANGAWEITRTDFITDVSLRIIISGVDAPLSPRWRIKIFKGSNITWPSIVNDKVVPNTAR